MKRAHKIDDCEWPGIVANLEAEVARLRAALEPFAALGARFKCLPDDPIWTDADDGLVAEDFYRASRAYQQQPNTK